MTLNTVRLLNGWAVHEPGSAPKAPSRRFFLRGEVAFELSSGVVVPVIIGKFELTLFKVIRLAHVH